jgi:hypothetical protein
MAEFMQKNDVHQISSLTMTASGQSRALDVDPLKFEFASVVNESF